MRRFLVVGNQTLGSEQLRAAIHERLASGSCQFHVVVPATQPRDHLFWSEGESTAVARRRLDEALTWMHADGTITSGSVGDANPVLAVTDALRGEEFDEIILSTLPPGPSRWIHQDLPRRLARQTDLPVCHVVAVVREAEAPR